MSESPQVHEETADLDAGALAEQARQRLQVAIAESRHGRPLPDLTEYLAGIPEPARSQLFEEFHSLEQSARRSVPGTVPDIKEETRWEQPAAAGATTEWSSGDLPAVSQVEATTEFAPSADGGVAAPHQETVKPLPAETFATTDYEPGKSGKQAADSSAKKKSKRDIPVPRSVAGYEILGVLGRGAMGVVYKATQPGLKRLVALKMILAGDHASEKELARFRTEAEAVAHLHHPNIVQIYHVGEDNGLPFFSLEFVEGDSLARHIDGTPQPPREAAKIVQTLATAMEAAHQRGIIHRDLKPANVLVAADGTPKITDFGLAKQLEDDSSQTRSGTVLGTPSYMAPEQAEGRMADVGPRSDVYSLGAVLYELLTGRAPFKAGSILDTLQQVKTQEPVAPIEFAPSVPRDLETICLKCLEKDPARRYASAAALADDLGRFLDGRPIVARPVSMPERLWRWAKRNPRIAALSAGIALVLAAYAATASVLAVTIKKEKDRTDEARGVALANAEKAEKNAQTAKTRHQLAVNRMIDLGAQLEKRVSARRFGPGASPELRRIRDDLLHLLRDSMVQMAKDIEGSQVTEYGMASAYQQLGDLLKKIGMGEEAVRQYQLGYDVMKKKVEETPDSDLARANMGVLLRRLGDMALELHGDVKAARARYMETYEIQNAILEHPKSNDYSEADKYRLLWQVVFELGKIELAAGDLDAAGRRFEEALTLSRQWLDLAKGGETSGPESSLAGDYLYLAVVADHSNLPDEARRNFNESLRLATNLAARFPNNVGYKADLAECYGLQGDFLLHTGRLDEADTCYQKLRENLAAVLNSDKEDLSRQRDVARTHERVASLALRQGKPDQAGTRFLEALKIREELSQTEPSNLTWRAAYAVALARVGKFAEAQKISDEIQKKAPASTPLLLQAARCQAICAAAGDAAQRKDAVTSALGLLKSATDNGWKDASVIETDPEFSSVRSEPAYQALSKQWRGR